MWHKDMFSGHEGYQRNSKEHKQHEGTILLPHVFVEKKCLALLDIKKCQAEGV